MLYDLTAIDEHVRRDAAATPERDFTVVYHHWLASKMPAPLVLRSGDPDKAFLLAGP